MARDQGISISIEEDVKPELKVKRKKRGPHNVGAPLGNQNAKGCTTSGSPKIYTDEWISNEAKLFMEWMTRPDSLYFTTFAVERGYTHQRLTEFAEVNIEFSDALKYAKHWQLSRLVNCGLKNETNSSITKFVLINNHNWVNDKTDSNDVAKQVATAIVNYAEALKQGEGWQPKSGS